MIEINMKRIILLLFDSKRDMMKVPSGMENKIGVSAASPNNPYVCHNRTIFRLRGVNTLFFGTLNFIYSYLIFTGKETSATGSINNFFLLNV